MFEFFANIFGYLLQFLYTLVNNYGLAIILFTLIIKLLLLPLSIKQQKTMKKSSELQEKVKVMQFKYKNDPEKLNKEMMNLYKTENVSPFSGCLTSIIQMLLLLSIFYLVRSPLTFMEKIPQENINTYIQQLKDEGKVISNVYPEIDLIRETELLKEKKHNFLKSIKMSEDDLLPKYECSICNDTGYIAENNSFTMCSCLKQKLINISYNKSNINKLDFENFSNFDINMYSDEINEEKYHSSVSPRQNILIIKKIVDNFLADFDNPKGKNLLFTGSPGLGKTFLSNCIAKELIDNGKIVLYQTAPIMLDNIIDCKFGKNNISKDFLDNIFNSDLLIIDDLGTESINNIKFTELFNVINTRILSNKKTIISTNLSIQNLFSIYDERIVSRIVGYYNICKFFGDDIRFKIRNI